MGVGLGNLGRGLCVMRGWPKLRLICMSVCVWMWLLVVAFYWWCLCLFVVLMLSHCLLLFRLLSLVFVVLIGRASAICCYIRTYIKKAKPTQTHQTPMPRQQLALNNYRTTSGAPERRTSRGSPSSSTLHRLLSPLVESWQSASLNIAWRFPMMALKKERTRMILLSEL